MKDPKKTSGGKAAPGPAGAKPGPGRGRRAADRGDPRSAPAPTAPPSVSAGALNALAAVRESATTEPKQAEKPAQAATKPARAPGAKAGGANAARGGSPARAPAAIAQRASRPAADRVSTTSDHTKPATASGASKPPPGKPVLAAPPSKPANAAPPAASGSAPPKPAEPRPAAPSPPSSPPTLRVVETAKPAPAPIPPPPTAQPAADPTSPSTGAEPPRGWGDAAGWAELNTKMLNLMRSQTEANLAIWRSTLGAGSLSEAIRMQTSGVREAYEATAAQWRDIAETAARLMGGSGVSMKLPWTDQER